ncbi:MAG: hypothetical protein HY726_09475 [Candidatus Rokubacteria bacterium]|nr:hypothetical protein [Candidatus Rokubacteria bacterium]
MAEILCPSCRHFAPALDPNISKAFLGACKKKEAPFLLILPKEGVTECEVYERAPRPAQVAATTAAVKAEAKAAPAQRRVVFLYSSGHRPGEQFPCDPKRALSLLDQLKSTGVACEVRDLASVKDVFPDYHKAVTGPSAQKRPVFGMPGAREEEFGRRVPALMIFEGDRYPTEVYPRMDRELNRVLGVEEALERLLKG